MATRSRIDISVAATPSQSAARSQIPVMAALGLARAELTWDAAAAAHLDLYRELA